MSLGVVTRDQHEKKTASPGPDYLKKEKKVL
jgi:hypothetical protein